MKNLRPGKRSGALVLAVGALVALTMFVVLPALASTVNDGVPPASGIGGLLPVDIGVGGNQSCSSAGLFPGMTNVQQTTDSSPSTGTYPSGQGWNFSLTLGALPNFTQNKGQSLAIDSGGHAAIVGIAIKGGNDNLSYDYRATAQGWVTKDTNLHAPASKFTAGTNPESGITQYYGVSQIVICYKTPLATISGKAYSDPNGNGTSTSPIDNLTVTLVDTSTSNTQTATTSSTLDASGHNYSFKAIPGDSYTVCISSPGSSYLQTAPSANTYCGAGNPYGYQFTSLGSGGQSAVNFGFEAMGSVSGTVYGDANRNGKNDDSANPPDSGPQSGWTATLYDHTGTQVGSPVTTGSSGAYSFDAALTPGQQYTVCEQPPANSGTWEQTEPAPSTGNVCGNLGSGNLEKGYHFTAGSSLTGWPTLTGYDFGNADALPCQSPEPVTYTDPNNPKFSETVDSCKEGQTYSFDDGFLSSGLPYIGVVAGDQSGALGGPLPTTQHLTLPDPTDHGNFQFTKLQYSDAFPFDPSQPLQEMPNCNSEDSGLGRLDGVKNPDGSAATSCLISSGEDVDTQTFNAVIYTTLDGHAAGF